MITFTWSEDLKMFLYLISKKYYKYVPYINMYTQTYAFQITLT